MVDAAKARYQNAAAQLSYAEIRSPISGVVADRPLNAGEMVSSGTAIITVMNISQVVARANVPVAQAALIRVGKPATISGPAGDLAVRKAAANLYGLDVHELGRRLDPFQKRQLDFAVLPRTVLVQRGVIVERGVSLFTFHLPGVDPLNTLRSLIPLDRLIHLVRRHRL